MKALYDIVKSPCLTEKGNHLQETQGKVIFKVDRRANKIEIKHAVENLFNVKVSKIATSMSTGDLKNPEIELLSNDEIGELQTAFNRMINTYKILDTLAKEDTE